jgi:hypothetical protein
MNGRGTLSLLRAVWRWLLCGPASWTKRTKIVVALGVIGIVAASAAAFCPWWRTEFSIRLAGYLLQLVALAFAVSVLLRIRAHFFGKMLRKTLHVWFRSWWRQRPWKRKAVVGGSEGQLAVTGCSARLEVWTRDNPEHSVEKRINAIINNLERLREADRKLCEGIDRLQDELDAYKKESRSEINDVESRIQRVRAAFHTGDWAGSFLGLLYLMVGVTFSTMAPELLALADMVLPLSR